MSCLLSHIQSTKGGLFFNESLRICIGSELRIPSDLTFGVAGCFGPGYCAVSAHSTLFPSSQSRKTQCYEVKWL